MVHSCAATKDRAGDYLPKSGRLRRFELRELRSERLRPNREEADDQLDVVVERLERGHGADAKRGVPNAQADLEAVQDGLVLVLVVVGGRFFLLATPIARPAVAARRGVGVG